MCVPGQRQSYLSSAVQGNSPQCADQHGPPVAKSHGRSSVVIPQEDLCSHSRPKCASSKKRHARAHRGRPGASSEVLRSRLAQSAAYLDIIRRIGRVDCVRTQITRSVPSNLWTSPVRRPSGGRFFPPILTVAGKSPQSLITKAGFSAGDWSLASKVRANFCFGFVAPVELRTRTYALCDRSNFAVKSPKVIVTAPGCNQDRSSTARSVADWLVRPNKKQALLLGPGPWTQTLGSGDMTAALAK